MSANYVGLPAVMFTRPQLASAGPTDQQALDAGYDCDWRTLDLPDVPRALVNSATPSAPSSSSLKGTPGGCLGSTPPPPVS
ncbi:hypothetical protein V3N99_08880 [Dermatophilaceae bacterium Soc4.6]